MATGARGQSGTHQPPQAAADAGAAANVQDIVVTATRREERLQNIPSSIQAVSGADLKKLGAVNFSDYARTVAGLSFIDAGPGRDQIFIRGVSTGGDASTGKESTVGVYIDETPVSEGSSQPDLKLYDIDHVEVLRGPQGTLYGSGSLGGTVRIITNQPQLDQTAGYIELQGSGTQGGGANGAANGWINVPLGADVAVRAVAYGIHNSGFLDNVETGARHINDENSYGGRLALRAKLGERLDAVLTGYYQHTHIGLFDRVSDDYPALKVDMTEPEPFTDKYGIVNLKLNYDLEFAKLVSSTSYFDRRRSNQSDIDYFLDAAFGVPRGTSIYGYRARTITQEFRLVSASTGPFQWLVGGFYLDRRDRFGQTINFVGTPPATNPGDNLYFSTVDAPTRQIAGFGELSYHLTPQLTATAGVRVSHDHRTNEAVQDGLALGGRTDLRGAFSETSTTPKFNLSWKPSANALVYAQAAKGFRVGGVNPGLPPCDPAAGCVINVGSTFKSDSLWNYEVGSKLTLAGGRLTLDASAFWIDWRNIQLDVSRGDGFDGFLNAGKARSRGVELEANGRLGGHVRLGGQLTYTDATLRRIDPSVSAYATPGQRLPQVPRWSSAANVEWGTPVAGDGRFYVRWDVQYVGRRISILGPDALPLDDYILANVRIGIDKGPYAASLFVTNLANVRAQLDRTLLFGARDGAPLTLDRYTINQPRTIGVTISRSFR